MRDVEYRTLPVRQDRQSIINDCKRSRTFMTTSGMRTYRMQPMVNNNAISKYQSISDRPQSTSPQPLAHSTPKPTTSYNTKTVQSRTTTANTARNGRTSQKLSESKPNSGVASTMHSLCLSPTTPHYRPGSSHSTTYNIRSSNCTPSHLYMNDDLRRAAVGISRASSGLTSKTEPVRDRFGKPITLPEFVKNNPHLKHKELSMGQKQYLWGIARIYSVHKLKTLKQLQYQSLLDHEFKRRLEKMGLKEREKIKEMKDYLRYTKYINTYEQRIPRHLRSTNITGDEERVAEHIRKHTIKGWTTKTDNMSQYSSRNAPLSNESTGDEIESQKYEKKSGKRGLHIYKHVIKGWTMDPSANDVFRDAMKRGSDTNGDDGVSLTELQSALDEDKSVYRVDIRRSALQSNDQDGVMTITKLSSADDAHLKSEHRTAKKTENGDQQIHVLLRDLAPQESNCL